MIGGYLHTLRDRRRSGMRLFHSSAGPDDDFACVTDACYRRTGPRAQTVAGQCLRSLNRNYISPRPLITVTRLAYPPNKCVFTYFSIGLIYLFVQWDQSRQFCFVQFIMNSPAPEYNNNILNFKKKKRFVGKSILGIVKNHEN